MTIKTKTGTSTNTETALKRNKVTRRDSENVQCGRKVFTAMSTFESRQHNKVYYVVWTLNWGGIRQKIMHDLLMFTAPCRWRLHLFLKCSLHLTNLNVQHTMMSKSFKFCNGPQVNPKGSCFQCKHCNINIQLLVTRSFLAWKERHDLNSKRKTLVFITRWSSIGQKKQSLLVLM